MDIKIQHSSAVGVMVWNQVSEQVAKLWIKEQKNKKHLICNRILIIWETKTRMPFLEPDYDNKCEKPDLIIPNQFC